MKNIVRVVLCFCFLSVYYILNAESCTGLNGVASIPGGGGGGGGGGGDLITGGKCLHTDVQVLMSDGKSYKKASDLVLGDLVWGDDGPNPIILAPVTKMDRVQAFIRFRTQQDFGTTLTPDHAVFARRCGIENETVWPIKKAVDLEAGECVPSAQGGEVQVVNVDVFYAMGRVQPFTKNGKIAVDGVVVSCYDYSTKNDTQETRHASLEPARLLYGAAEKIYNALSNEQYALGVLNGLIESMGLEKLYW